MTVKGILRYKFVRQTLYFIILIFSIEPIMNWYLRIGTNFELSSHGINIYISKSYMKEEKDSVYIRHIVDEAIQRLKGKNITESEWNINAYFYYTNDEWDRKSLYYMTDNHAKTHAYLNFMMYCSASLVENKISNYGSIRDLSETMAHELTHVYEYKKLGFLKYLYNRVLCNWKIEGFSDYIAGRTNIKFSEEMNKFENNYPDSSTFYTDYFLGHLRTDYLIRHRGISEDEYWNTNYNIEKLDNEIRQAIKNNEYKFENF